MINSAFHMRLERNDDLDCYILYPCGHVAAEDDVAVFVSEYIRLFAPLGRRVDVVIVLDMFTVAPCMIEKWSLARKDLVERYTNLSVRVSSGGYLAFGLKKNAAANSSYSDYEEDIASALELLTKKRRDQGREVTRPTKSSALG